MASLINASTASGGGVITTADASGILQLQTGGTTALTIDASQNIGINTSSPTSRLSIKGTTTTDAPTLGTEFITGGTWTSTGWTGNNTTGWINGASNATALSYSVAAVTATKYQIAYTVTGYSAGSFTVAFGGQSLAYITATGTFGPTAITTGNLVITPTATFVGTIIISVKAITAGSTALVSMADSSGISTFEVRVSSAHSTGLWPEFTNTFIGLDSGKYNTTGYINTSVGNGALQYNTTGWYNSSVGVNALQQNTTGSNNAAFGVASLQYNLFGNYNTAFGTGSLQNNTSGSSNAGFGYYALATNTTGNFNTVFGIQALFSNTTGSYNTAVGINALLSNTIGSNSVALGVNAGRYIANGSTALTVVNNSTYIGYNTKASADSVTNETVIGHNATGSGSNTITLGGSDVTGTVIPYGNFILKAGSLQEVKTALAALNVNISLGNYFTKTITAISTLTVSNVPTTGTVASFVLDLTNGGAFAITWWSGMKWAGGTAPTLTTSGRDILEFFTHDAGTTWNGLVLAKDIK